MKIFIKDLIDLLNVFTLLDYILFFSVVFLLILVLILVYFIKINEAPKETFEQKPIKNEDKINVFSSYEEEQEKKAVISYEELKKVNQNKKINYEEEINIDGINIKKINLQDLYTDEEEPVNESRNIIIIDTRHEEEFLNTLKRLQSVL